MRKAIVTGAAGFIGGWLTLELLEAQYDVVVIVRNSKKLIGEIASNPHVTIIEKDLNDLVPEDIPGRCVARIEKRLPLTIHKYRHGNGDAENMP